MDLYVFIFVYIGLSVNGSVQIANKSVQIANGSVQIVNGSVQIANGSFQIANGSAQIANGPGKIANGSVQIGYSGLYNNQRGVGPWGRCSQPVCRAGGWNIYKLLVACSPAAGAVLGKKRRSYIFEHIKSYLWRAGLPQAFFFRRTWRS